MTLLRQGSEGQATTNRPECGADQSSPKRYRFFEARPGYDFPNTGQYDLINHRSGAPIGIVGWYPPWRQWCFFPHAETVWSEVCLRDVLDFIGRLPKRGPKCAGVRSKP